jgi:hypothetical protein
MASSVERKGNQSPPEVQRATAYDERTFAEEAAMAPMTMTIERVMAFNGLDVLVARDEGLFAAEGLDLRIAMLPPSEIRPATEGTFSKPVTNQGKLQARGEAAMFTA